MAAYDSIPPCRPRGRRRGHQTRNRRGHGGVDSLAIFSRRRPLQLLYPRGPSRSPAVDQFLAFLRSARAARGRS